MSFAEALARRGAVLRENLPDYTWTLSGGRWTGTGTTDHGHGVEIVVYTVVAIEDGSSHPYRVGEVRVGGYRGGRLECGPQGDPAYTGFVGLLLSLVKCVQLLSDRRPWPAISE